MNRTLFTLGKISIATLALAACAHNNADQAAVTAAHPSAAPAAPMSTPDAQFRAMKPAPASNASDFTAPVPTERTLSNGARLLVVENHAVPLVAIDLMIETGVDGEPTGKTGLATFVANMLTEGTKTRTATQIAEQTEDLATLLTPFPGKETTQIFVNSLTETLPASLDLLADIVINPAFRKEDVERERGLLLTDLEQKNANPSALARDELSRILYGDKHPWGQPEGGTAATIGSIKIADLQKFHDTYFRPTNAIISVSGDVSPDDIQKLLEAKLAGWKKRPRVAVKLPKMKAQTGHSVVLVDKPGASQSQVWTFGPAVAAKDPDAVALRVASYIVGGPFQRLDMNLRENKAYSYGVRAAVTLQKDQGYWLASGAVKAGVTAEAFTEMKKELTTFADGTLRDGELMSAHAGLVRSVPTVLERNMGVAQAMATLAFNGQPLDYYRTLPAAVEKVDAATVARVAAKYDRPDAWSIVIVGPRAASEEKLKAMNLGNITVKNVEAAVGKDEAAARSEKKTITK